MLRLNRWFPVVGIVMLALLITPPVLAQDEVDGGRVLVQQVIEQLWSAGNVDFIDEAFAHDFVLIEPQGVVTAANLPHQDAYAYRRYGPRGIYKAQVAAVHAAFPDLQVRGTLIGRGEYVLHQWVMNGTFSQPLNGTMPNGQPAVWYGMDMYRIKDSKIVEMRCIEDTAAAHQVMVADQFTPERTGWMVTAGESKMAPEAMIGLAERSIRTYNTGQRDDAVFTSDFTLHLPLSSFPAPLDQEGYFAWVRGNHVLWPDCNVCPGTPNWADVMHVDGDMLFYPFAAIRTHNTADYLGNPPNGVHIEIPGLALLRFENGRIAEMWYLYDPAVLIAGLSA